MKIKVGRRIFNARKVKLSLLCLFSRQIRRLFHCLRSKISLLRSRGRIPGCMRPSLKKPETGNGTLVRPLQSSCRKKGVPKGCVAIYVGEEKNRYVIPILYLYHPFISKLLVEAEMEFGYHNRGALTLPCHTDDFEQLKWLIDREKS
ncbi:hypothetical protein SUGI_0629860 [Cryptomeria japonica]|nr:hypothetical protein SUGI_0629860 [Cryptomeria japonica]